MSSPSIIVTVRFSFTYDDRLRADSTENTTIPNNISTNAVLIHKVMPCNPWRMPVLLRFLPIIPWL